MVLVQYQIDKRLKHTKTEQLLEPFVVVRVTDFHFEAVKQFATDINKAINTGQTFVPIIIDSFGGQVYSLMEMVTQIQRCPIPVHTIVEGKAFSAGAMLFAMGNERYMSPNATLMIHLCSNFVHGHTGQIQTSAKETERIEEKMFSMIDKNIGNEEGKLLSKIKDKNLDWYLDAEEALANKICTKIGSLKMTVKAEVSYTYEW